jgi:hypothetical protein
MTEHSYALVKVYAGIPTDQVAIIVTVNNQHSMLSPPIKFSSMPIVVPTFAWAKTTNSLFPMSGHAAASFQQKIYVTGGVSERAYVGVGSVFSVACLEWIESFSIPCPRVRHGMVECNGCLWMMGGCSDEIQEKCSASMDIYDVSKRKWVSAPRMPLCTADFAAVSHKGCIYIIGGSASPTKIHIFDCNSSTWETVRTDMK